MVSKLPERPVASVKKHGTSPLHISLPSTHRELASPFYVCCVHTTATQSTTRPLLIMVAINGRDIVRRTVGILRNRYNRYSAKLPDGGPPALSPLGSFAHTDFKKPSPEVASVSPEGAWAQVTPNGEIPKGRKQGRVKRRRYNELAQDNSTFFMPGGFRNGLSERKVLHRRSKRDLHGDYEPDGCDEDRFSQWADYEPANEHQVFVMKQFRSLMFDKLKRESQFRVKVISERVRKQAPERKARMRKEAIEAEKLRRMEELERREEKERADRWKDQRLAQLEREKRAAENELARERLERKQSKLRRLFQEQQQRHKELRWKQLREREARLAAEREDNLLRENALLEKGLRATDNAFRRARNERDYMAQEKEEERGRRLRAEESLRRWKELMKECFPGGQQQQHPGQQREQPKSQPKQDPPLEAQFELYEKKWEVLRSGVDTDGAKIHLILFSQIPWPVVNITPTNPSQIRPEHIQEFLTHPLREKYYASEKRKTTRMKARDELLKWHSDKFDQFVLSKVYEEDKLAVSEAVGMIIRVLTKMLN